MLAFNKKMKPNSKYELLDKENILRDPNRKKQLEKMRERFLLEQRVYKRIYPIVFAQKDKEKLYLLDYPNYFIQEGILYYKTGRPVTIYNDRECFLHKNGKQVTVPIYRVLYATYKGLNVDDCKGFIFYKNDYGEICVTDDKSLSRKKKGTNMDSITYKEMEEFCKICQKAVSSKDPSEIFKMVYKNEIKYIKYCMNQGTGLSNAKDIVDEAMFRCVDSIISGKIIIKIDSFIYNAIKIILTEQKARREIEINENIIYKSKL